MATLTLIVLVSLGIVFLWGLLSPRSQWRVLVSWSYRDPYRNEPTGIVYGLYRVIAVIGIASMVVSGVLVYRVQLENEPKPPVPPTAVELMWGSPEPVVVNRVLQPVKTPPTGLVDQPILGYQGMVGKTRQPPYLFSLAHFDIPEAITDNGLIGTDPSVGLVALDTAGLVVRVAGDPQCFPHAAVVKETDDTVTIGIYYGRAKPTGSNVGNVDQCQVLASALNVSTIIPIPLVEPLGDRAVRTLDGSPIRRVDLVP
ncbi:MAG: hypothetical protein IT190_06130 [Microbacteriaceae bacterium]|nr:hypothetical protein [Microbacteriaceae bacterium]